MRMSLSTGLSSTISERPGGMPPSLAEMRARLEARQQAVTVNADRV